MSTQTDKLVAAMPGTLAEIVERTGYPVDSIMGRGSRDGWPAEPAFNPGLIVLARALGIPVYCRRDAGVTVYTQEPIGEQNV